MRAKVVFEPVAEGEVATAHNWYRTHSSDLGLRFLAVIDEAIESMVALPLRHSIVATVDNITIRRVRIKKFPYAMYFVHFETEDMATREPLHLFKIIALRHDKQRAVIWPERLN